MTREELLVGLDSKEVAQVLTPEGFLRWAEGEPLSDADFKPCKER